MDSPRNLAEALRRLAPARKHLLLVLLLLVAHAGIFAHSDGWKDAQAPGDDPSYVEMADRFWNLGVHQSMTWSPEYVVLMSPFVGLLGQEAGYKAWRFTLFAGLTILVYSVFTRMFDSAWYGAVLALYTQMFWGPYASPSLQTLAAVLILTCLLLLQSQAKYLGFVFGLLLNGIFVSGVVNTIMTAFGAFCAVTRTRELFRTRFYAQFAVGAAVFALVVVTHSFDLAKYPEEALVRGRAGLLHQVCLFVFSSGRSAAYLGPDENAPNTYHGHLAAIDRYFEDKFGIKEAQLRQRNMDDRWPKFLLNWPWMYEKDPELMKDYFVQEIHTLIDSLFNAFQIIIPYGKYDMNTTSRIRGNYHLPLLALLLLPCLAGLARRNPQAPCATPRTTLLQFLFAVSTFAIFVPLMLVNPLLIYFPPLIPAYLMGVALCSSFLGLAATKLARRLRKGA